MAFERKHDWLSLESRWIAGEWRTLKEMSEKTGVTYRMLQRRSFEHRWTEKREAVETEAAELARKRAVKGLADRLTEANERALKNAALLSQLGLNRFMDEQGNLKIKSIANEATAIHAIKAAIQIEQAILRRLPLGDGEPGEGPIIPTDGVENLTDAELDEIIKTTSGLIAATKPVTPPAGTKAGGGRRKKKKASRTR